MVFVISVVCIGIVVGIYRLSESTTYFVSNGWFKYPVSVLCSMIMALCFSTAVTSVVAIFQSSWWIGPEWVRIITSAGSTYAAIVIYYKLSPINKAGMVIGKILSAVYIVLALLTAFVWAAEGDFVWFVVWVAAISGTVLGDIHGSRELRSFIKSAV